MKKNLTIIALLLIVSVAFFSCDNRDFSGFPVSLDQIVIDSPAEIGAMLAPLNFYNQSGEPVGVTKSVNKITFVMDSGTDNHGARLTLPAIALMYSEVEVTFKLDANSGGAGNVPKIGFKAAVGSDLTPYDDFEIHWGSHTAVGDAHTQVIPMSKIPAGSFLFNHNQYSDDTKAPINYTLEITEIVLNP